jgi:hypothetical protein
VTDKVLANIGSVDNLVGFDVLQEEDKARLAKDFELGYVQERREIEEAVSARDVCVCVCVCVCTSACAFLCVARMGDTGWDA